MRTVNTAGEFDDVSVECGVTSKRERRHDQQLILQLHPVGYL
jgi:hypothetical protein